MKHDYAPIVRALCRDAGWPEPLTEQRLIPGRRFRCDFVWPEQKIVVEVQGGVWLPRGGHTGGKGQIDDMWKLNALTLQGYRVLQVTPKQVTDGELRRLLALAFAAEPKREALR